MLRRLMTLLGLLGCAPAAPPAPPPPHATPSGPTSRVVGEIDTIRLSNINKAQGHYTWNVELVVSVRSATPEPQWPVAKALAVRLPDRPTWESLTEAQRAAVAPNGPQHVLAPTEWAGFRVGDAVDLVVVFTSPDLAHLAAP